MWGRATRTDWNFSDWYSLPSIWIIFIIYNCHGSNWKKQSRGRIIASAHSRLQVRHKNAGEFRSAANLSLLQHAESNWGNRRDPGKDIKTSTLAVSHQFDWCKVFQIQQGQHGIFEGWNVLQLNFGSRWVAILVQRLGWTQLKIKFPQSSVIAAEAILGGNAHPAGIYKAGQS